MKSKTIWFNIITAALAVVNSLSGTVIPQEIAIGILAIGNVIIKIFTMNAGA
nr:MAG: hypothetical protein [Microviridae sp.]